MGPLDPEEERLCRDTKFYRMHLNQAAVRCCAHCTVIAEQAASRGKDFCEEVFDEDLDILKEAFSLPHWPTPAAWPPQPFAFLSGPEDCGIPCPALIIWARERKAEASAFLLSFPACFHVAIVCPLEGSRPRSGPRSVSLRSPSLLHNSQPVYYTG